MSVISADLSLSRLPLAGLLDAVKRVVSSASEALARAEQTRADEMLEAFAEQVFKPIWTASSREEFWERRDAMFRRGIYWLELLSRVIQGVAKQSELYGKNEGQQPLRQLEQNPPRFLSARARAYLIDGFRMLEAVISRPENAAQREGVAQGKPFLIPEELRNNPRSGRVAGSIFLLEAWATLLASGVQPRSDEVAESIAKNFANVYGGLVGIMSNEAQDGSAHDD